MSRLNLSPNHCSCTVIRARNLIDKGKGVNAFCKISLGKEKFATAVREKTTSPDWQEQCDMAIVDGDTSIKLTVYNEAKSSLSDGDFLGRAVVSLRDLPDYDRVHTNWYKLTSKEGKMDKDRGEIQVSLQFYSQNNVTGSVLDLATKKKHGSLRDIKQAFKNKIKAATHHTKHDKNGGDNQLKQQRNRLDGDDGSSHTGRDFLEDSPSDTTSYTGSHISVNSIPNNNNNNLEQHKKKSRAPTNGTQSHSSSRRSITSDYETSSILDSSSMYGGDEHSTSSNPFLPQHEVNLDEYIKPKKKGPAPVITSDSSPAMKRKETDINPKADKVFGLSIIKESHDTNDSLPSKSKQQHTDDELNLDNYFKQPIEQKRTKKPAPILQQSKESKRSILSQSDDIKTPPTSLSIKTNSLLNQSNNCHDSTDEDVDELLGHLERMSSMRSSVKRRIQPPNDIMQESFYEPDNRNLPPSGRTPTRTLPDIVVEQRGTNPSQSPAKSSSKNLNILGYNNVKSTPVNPKVRQELEHIDREELLHIIAHQSDIIKKRDTRLKDLEQYTDGLLVKIVEQCPSILQVGSSLKR